MGTTETTTDTATGGEVVTVEMLNTAFARFTRWEREARVRLEEFRATEQAYGRAREELDRAAGDLTELVKRAGVQGGVR